MSILAHLFLPSFSVSLSYFIFAVPLRECLGKHSCMSFTFSVAILNSTCFFIEAKMVLAVAEASPIEKLIKLNRRESSTVLSYIG